MDKEEKIELPINTDVEYNATKFIDLACEFTKFAFIYCLKPDNNKWHVKVSKYGVAEMTNTELFHYFMEETKGDKNIWK